MTRSHPILDPTPEPCGATDGEVAQLSPGVTGERVDARFAADPKCIREARRFVTEQLADRSAPMIRDVVLMVSELTTNCVKHAHSAFSVSLVTDDRAICVEVTDTGTGTPTPQQLNPERASGRGLQIVEQLADSWGVTRTDGPGKTVWFTLDPSLSA